MGGRPSSTRVRKQRVFEGMVNSTTPGLSFASAKGGRHHFIRSALSKFPLRVACFTDHAAARFCRTGKEKEDQDWEPEEEEPEEEEPQEEELDEEDLLEVRAKKGTKTKKTKTKTMVRLRMHISQCSP